MESHVLREVSPRRLRSCKKQSPSRVARRTASTSSDESCTTTPTKSDINSTPARAQKRPTPRPRRKTVRHISISTTSSDTSHSVTPEKLPTRRCASMSKMKPVQNERQTRQSVKRVLRDIDSGSDDESQPEPSKRALRSGLYRH